MPVSTPLPACRRRVPVSIERPIPLSPSLHWPAPTVATEIPPDRGPVLVTVEDTIDPARAREFGAEAVARGRRAAAARGPA